MRTAGFDGEFNAEFDLEPCPRDAASFDIILKSRGGRIGSSSARNPEYNQALEEILRRLSLVNADIVNIEVDSAITRSMSPEQRRLSLDFPILLRQASDFHDLRRKIGRAQTSIGRASGSSSSSSGNSTKQIRIQVSANSRLSTIRSAADLLGQVDPPQAWPQDENDLGLIDDPIDVEVTEPIRWWSSNRDERYWMEISDRPDPGADLNAPAFNEDGNEYWSYSFVKEVLDGDVVFHWSKGEGSETGIIGYSSVSGPYWDDEVFWSARGRRSRDITEYPRPGFRRALVRFTPLEEVMTLSAIRHVGSEVLEIADLLELEHGNLPIYYPFTPYGPDPSRIRTAQGYLVKFPSSLVELLGLEVQLVERDLVSDVAAIIQEHQGGGEALGVAYRVADEEAGVSTAEPNSPDPALMERGLRAHRRTQNLLAEWLSQRGLTPLSPSPNDPDWDIAWFDDGLLYVCEVKSLTDANEERQLRMGLGQVLRYRQRAGGNAKAVLALEREPRDQGWLALCDQLEIQVAWDGHWARLL